GGSDWRARIASRRSRSRMFAIYQYRMASDHLSSATVQRRLVSLKCFGTWLVKQRHLHEHPLVALEYPRKEKRLPRVVPWDDVEVRLAEEPRLSDRAILALLIYGGLRRGELVTLDVRHFSLSAANLHVQGRAGRIASSCCRSRPSRCFSNIS